MAMIADTFNCGTLIFGFFKRDARYHRISKNFVRYAAHRSFGDSLNFENDVFHFGREYFLSSNIYNVALSPDKSYQPLLLFNQVSGVHPTALIDWSGCVEITKHRRF